MHKTHTKFLLACLLGLLRQGSGPCNLTAAFKPNCRSGRDPGCQPTLTLSWFIKRGIRCVSRERLGAKKNRLRRGRREGSPPRCDGEAYTGRNVVERAMNHLKDFRAVATRCNKRRHNLFTAVLVATLMIWLL
ncbi:transposase [Massilia scottii]|uniref:transposase n=1 Tax=Massilia scottii TaxID=3057166 RepID=UPI0035B55C5F